jgi:Fe-S-cluster containining protein
MPTYECDCCGACCGAYFIFASDEDAHREPRIAQEARKLPESHATAEYRYHLYPLPFLQACGFLGDDRRCTIYETRPDVCRQFAAGGHQCQLARERKGLPPLPPQTDRVAA